ncbi:MAG TPA: SDR family oxidoreductase [Acidimicrobiales bacterium]|nr:SDR family oxidoreductase [Acidimicrobiales bacterium]
MARTLITGCSSGFGRATAIELKARGHEVVATARRPETLDGLDVDARLALDVTDDASVAAALSAAGEVDALVNNAGVSVGGPVEKVPLDEVRRLFETNFFGALRMAQAVLPQMRVRGRGTIVNVSSVNGRVAQPLSGSYAATKFALEAMSEALHFEAGHFGIRTVVIEPGYFRTNLGGARREFGVDSAPYDERRAGPRGGGPSHRRCHRERRPRPARPGGRGGGDGPVGPPDDGRRLLRGRHAGHARRGVVSGPARHLTRRRPPRPPRPRG